MFLVRGLHRGVQLEQAVIEALVGAQCVWQGGEDDRGDNQRGGSDWPLDLTSHRGEAAP
jgi:hypothetical protein